MAVARLKPDTAAMEGTAISKEPNCSCSAKAVLSPKVELGYSSTSIAPLDRSLIKSASASMP